MTHLAAITYIESLKKLAEAYTHELNDVLARKGDHSEDRNAIMKVSYHVRTISKLFKIDSNLFSSEFMAWLTKRAADGDPFSQDRLAFMTYHGVDVWQDYGRAFKLYTLAAEQGVPHAQYNLGVMYQHGVGVSQSDKESQKWYKLGTFRAKL